MSSEPVIPTRQHGEGPASSDLVAQGYDAVYAAMADSPTFLRIWKENATGPDYPEEFYHISFLTLAELRRMASELRVSHGMTFADLACGMGGPGLWLARETQASLVGIDLSAVGVAQATRRAEALGLASVAQFSTGAFEETGIDTGSLNAAMSVDALQYAPSKHRAFREIARIVRPDGRFAFTAFEVDPERAGLPVVGVDPVENYRPLLENAGFRILAYEETPTWRERLTRTFRAVVAAEQALKDEMGPLAAAALLSEVTLTLERDLYLRRVFAVAARLET